MSTSNAVFRNGAALAVTVGVAYASCAAIFSVWPGAAMDFMNALFHGLDFRKLEVTNAGFEFSGFIYALIGISVWAFILGALYGWLQSLRGDPR